ncbi:MAG: class I SAM-dependent methyltransferase [Bryobacteraceae bacterium]
MACAVGPSGIGALTFAVQCQDGSFVKRGGDFPDFTLVVKAPRQFEWFLNADIYSAAIGFIRGDFDIQGDIVSAVAFKTAHRHPAFKDLLTSAVARFSPGRIESWFQTKARAAENIRFHYDRSNDFYRQFLDPRMLYSSADFSDAEQSLEDAQLAKLNHICQKLDIRPGESFLDVGCGCGALVVQAAESYGATATGCTLSQRQAEIARQTVGQRGLDGRVTIREIDYRTLTGHFSKIASIGMFEHVGVHRLAGYFRKVFELLDDEGLFLNRGITRPEHVADGPETLILQRKIFPGGELPHLSVVVREAEAAGFDVLEARSFRQHYALTCRRWVDQLRKNAAECLNYVSAETYRAWLLYLAGSAVSFEAGVTGIHQVLLAKRRSLRARRLNFS